MERWVNKLAIVTGSSSGIGKAVAEELVRAGVKVVGLARRNQRLSELSKKLEGSKGEFYGHPCDVTKEDDILKVFKWAIENVGPVHILVNNAGIRGNTTLVDGDTQMWRQMFDTNVLGLCIATREAVQNMKTNNIDGHIIHINSIGGHKPIFPPNISVYPATKFSVTALTETLRQELISIGSKIKVSSISPAFVATEIRQAAGRDTTSIGKDYFLNSQDVADAVMYVLGTPLHVQVHELILRHVQESV